MNTRTLQQIIASVPTSDGAGVKLRRSLGQRQGVRLDPFLMLDEFSSDNADDYIAGFPSHPHRGFETITYMLDGHMRHEDHLGHRGELKSGGVQWMRAGRGIIHSEMPQQESGRMRGFQLWVNLPAKEKMSPAAYRDIPASEIPVVEFPGGGWVKVIAGTLRLDERSTSGPIQGLTTDLLYLDVSLPAGKDFSHELPHEYNAFVYPYEGQVFVGPQEASRQLTSHAAGVLSKGDHFVVRAEEGSARFFVLAGKALHEPIAQYGPFVMNTREEVEQAMEDYRNGVLT